MTAGREAVDPHRSTKQRERPGDPLRSRSGELAWRIVCFSGWYGFPDDMFFRMMRFPGWSCRSGSGLRVGVTVRASRFRHHIVFDTSADLAFRVSVTVRSPPGADGPKTVLAFMQKT